MSSLSVFQFESQEIRFVDGKPIANDVAIILGYADPQSTISKKVSAKNKGVAKVETPGGIQSMTVLEEAGVYQLIFSSKLPDAEKFQDWVFDDVLPSIRKTGNYSISSTTPTTPALPVVTPAEQIKMVVDCASAFGIDLSNPRFKQGYQDWFHQTLGIGVTPMLPGTSEERWRGGAERAEELGFGRVGADPSLRVRLGNFLSRQTWDENDRRKEERICNGENRPIWIYKICDRFDDCIRAFFQMKSK